MYSDPGKTLSVPVGEDQVSHVEFSRELVRRFNFYYGFSISDKLYQDNNACSQLAVRSISLRILNQEGTSRTTESELAIRNYVAEVGIENFLDMWKAERFPPYFEAKRILTEPGVLLTPTPRLPA